MDIEDDTEHITMAEEEKTLVDGEKMEEEGELKELQHEFAELTEYLNRLETSYNQSLSYIAGLEEIMGHVSFVNV